MNDLNNPQRMNIQGDDAGGGGDSRWGYVLVVPMLCLAVFRSIWTRRAKQSRLHDALLAQEEFALAGARASLHALESALEKRQSVYCNWLVPRQRRRVLERDMLRRARSEVALGRMAVHDGLLDIFNNDRHCAQFTNEDSKRNGKLMWVYVQHWHTLLELHKYQQVQQRLHTEDPLEPPSARGGRV
ncbi:coiled-coil domain-containing protein 127-like [Lethenteron reissneri]|uniref:coiled-coil domain-containing protein 127-like n=1 Tax=Lethenteron reissneri TaxID=7753 RepID=UPI002AB790DA|nr:coiled-coil domain-containing protein 127-like [Lethenteron reissneri]XP_061429808.1 coiled-coil domain-containing protein 127-like [Lethenteron reissneri]XP_061429809.1 coiled-coil domain-containing protein 127-like [Lethenteron reissneri]